MADFAPSRNNRCYAQIKLRGLFVEPLLTSRWTDRTVANRHPTALRLLVVDDYRVGADAITAVLLSEGYDVRCVLSGDAALKLIDHWIPDIALLDINMPGMDGFELARRLRELHSMRDTALVAFTSQDERVTRSAGVQVGFDAYCQKTGTTGVLLRLLVRITH
ncbi:MULTISPECIES: response regulator [unclassified Caballeronia]|uniref:response regulator n=1 Tax=unclassified Caballeronia TaxID=2646786 RepID=UPI00285C2000|nr:MULTISPECIES: response regulator [unclassified Caballeronia]MDR5777333.1 response regulator [Caballeronia sp. LZ002]MDR5852785.1 response regulator [Caballeronia sp. LZ003]